MFYRFRWLGVTILFIVALPASRCELEDGDHVQGIRHRQFEQPGSGYNEVAASYRPVQTLMSKNTCRGRSGYVADTSRNCQVFYNCLPDGTITTSTCPGNYQFDETTQCCKMPHDVNCAGLLGGAGGTSQLRPTISCTGKRGFFPDFPSGCRIFYFCEPSGRSRQLSCPDGLLFNEQIGCCDIAQNVHCGSVDQSRLPDIISSASVNVPVDTSGDMFCRNHRPGFYANPIDCSTYYYCQSNGRHNLLHCPTGQAFNEMTSSCDNDLSHCYGIQVDRGVFDCSGRNGWYQGNDPQCRFAFYCNAGNGYMHTCPNDLRWNPQMLSCDPASTVPCPTSGINQPNTGRPPPVLFPPITAPSHAIPSISYGSVVPSVMTQRPPFTDYAFTTSEFPPLTFTRGNININNVGIQTYPPLPVSYAGPTTTITSHYNNVNFPTGAATSTEYFSGNNNNNNNGPNIVNTNPGLGIDNTFDCRGKIGYYAIVESGCQQFVYCNPEGIAHRFVCPGTLLFNNSIAVCDWPQNVRCQNQYTPGFLPNTQNPPNYDCRGKDGFFADQSRGGRVFYLCHADGIKYQYVCPANLVFNERNSVCDWPDYMKQAGFTPGPNASPPQNVQIDWGGPPLECRMRPAGYYANPNNNQIYGRCTPDGTFFAMACPKGTVFDQALGSCVFPFQVGQRPETGTPPSSGQGGGGNILNPQDQGGHNNGGNGGGSIIYTQDQNNHIGGGGNNNNNEGNGEVETIYTPPVNTINNGHGGGGGGNTVYTQPNSNGGGGRDTQYTSPNSYNNNANIYPQTPFVYSSSGNGRVDTSTEQYYPPSSVGSPNYAVNTNVGQQYPGSVTTGIYTAQLYPYTGPGSPAAHQPTTPISYLFGHGNGDYGNINNNNLDNRPQMEYTTRPSSGSPGNGFVNSYPAYTNSYSPPANTPSSGQSTGNGYFQGEEYGLQSGFQHQPQPGRGQGQYVTQQGPPSDQNQGGNYDHNTNEEQGGQTYQQNTDNGGGNNYYQTQIDNYNGPHPGYVPTPTPQSPAVCLGRTGMFAERASNCRRYTVCRADGTGVTRNCPVDMAFNEISGECDSAPAVDCFTNTPGIVQPAVPVCLNGETANTFVPDPVQSCVTFYNCEQNGRGTQFRCPPGTQFNSRINACDDPRNCNCVGGNGGTINIRIPVPVSSDLNSQYSSNQNMELDIRLRRPPITVGMLPLVPGYDGSMYADATGTHARLPTFYADDDSITNMTSLTLSFLFPYYNETYMNITEFDTAASSPSPEQVVRAEKKVFLPEHHPALSVTTHLPPVKKEEYFRINSKKKKVEESTSKIKPRPQVQSSVT